MEVLSSRVLLRPSGTEPLVRVMVEADTEEARQKAERPTKAAIGAWMTATASSLTRAERLDRLLQNDPPALEVAGRVGPDPGSRPVEVAVAILGLERSGGPRRVISAPGCSPHKCDTCRCLSLGSSQSCSPSGLPGRTSKTAIDVT